MLRTLPASHRLERRATSSLHQAAHLATSRATPRTASANSSVFTFPIQPASQDSRVSKLKATALDELSSSQTRAHLPSRQPGHASQACPPLATWLAPSQAASEWRAPAHSGPCPCLSTVARKPKAKSSHCQTRPPPRGSSSHHLHSSEAVAAAGAGGSPALTVAEVLGCFLAPHPVLTRELASPTSQGQVPCCQQGDARGPLSELGLGRALAAPTTRPRGSEGFAGETWPAVGRQVYL